MLTITKRRTAQLGLLLLIGCASSSYERGYFTETLVEQSINEFHERLDNERYHDIYANADADLRSRVSEAEFTSRLANAHQQSGDRHGKALVFVKDSLSRFLRQGFRPRRELISHTELASSQIAIGREKFVWAGENHQAKLVRD